MRQTRSVSSNRRPLSAAEGHLRFRLGLWLCLFLLSPVATCGQGGSDTLRTILDKHIQAIGGREAVAGIKSMIAYAQLEYMGLYGSMISIISLPAGYYIEYDLGVMSLAMGFDGVTGWATDANGITRRSIEEEIRPLINELYFKTFSYALAGGMPGKAEYRRDTSIDGQDYHLLALFPDGGDSLAILINGVTGLVDYRLEVITGLASVTKYSDFHTIGGVKTPFAIDFATPGAPFKISARFDSAKVNRDIPDSLFRMPGARQEDFRFGNDADSVIIPFRPANDHLFVSATVNGKGPFDFLLDSGAGMSVLSSRLADSLRIAVKGNIPTRGVGGYGSIGFATIDSLALGDLTLQFSRVTILDFSSLDTNLGWPLGGILGYDFFARFKTTVDFDGRRLVLSRSDGKPCPIEAQSAPFDVFAQVPVMEVYVNGRPTRVMLDLGAQTGLVLRGHARALAGIEISRGEESRIRISGVGGTRAMRQVTIDSLRIGNVTLREPTALVAEDFASMPFPEYIEGLLGVTILKRFNLVIDYAADRICLESRKNRQE